MSLQSQLFRGDSKLEAAALSDPAHVLPGARGPHVEKIQRALIQVDAATITPDGIYGPATAAAVADFKRNQRPQILNFAGKIDDIVGIKTMAALDREMVEKEQKTLGPLEITLFGDRSSTQRMNLRKMTIVSAFRSSGNTGRSNFGFGASNVTAPPNGVSQKLTRWDPGVVGRIKCAQTGGNSIATCTNNGDIAQDDFQLTKYRTGFLSEVGVAAPPEGSDLRDGGKVLLTQEPHFMRFETFRPGDASIFVVRGNVARILFVEVRAQNKGPVARAPLTKLLNGSQFFSASQDGGEPDPRAVFTGRPVNPKRGGRLINLGGDQETPEFEDYQVDLTHSQAFDRFRPWADDLNDPSVFIPNQSTSHITMRGTPFLPLFKKVAKRIAQPGCRFTFNGEAKFVDEIKSALPGRQLEVLPDTNASGFVLLTWEIN